MKYFIDFEFEEKGYKNGIAIEIISIGIVSLNDDKLYLVNKEYDWSECKNNWLLSNVKPFLNTQESNLFINDFFVNFSDIKKILLNFFNSTKDENIELYGYFSAYDHVCLSAIFGRMIDLPKDIPMYTKDLKQYCDNFFLTEDIIKEECKINGNEHCSIDDAKWNKELYFFIKNISEEFIYI